MTVGSSMSHVIKASSECRMELDSHDETSFYKIAYLEH